MSEFSPIALLESRHERNQFDCGTAPLNFYLKQFALQNQKKGLVRNYVTCRGLRIVGYYAFAYGSVLRRMFRRNLPRDLANTRFP